MNLVSMHCPDCGAQINIDYDRPAQFCMFCGSKICLDVKDLDALLQAKERTRQIHAQNEVDMERLRIKREQSDVANERERYKLARLKYQDEEEKRHPYKKIMRVIGKIIIAAIAIYLAIFVLVLIASFMI